MNEKIKKMECDNKNNWGNCKIILNDTYTFDNKKYYKGKKYLALKLENEYFLSIGGRFYFLLPKETFKETSK